MATRRSQIEVVVLGLSDLQALNTALGTHDRRLQSLTVTYQAFNAAVNSANPGLNRFGNTLITVNNATNNVNRSINTTNNQITNMGNAANRAGGQFDGMLGTMLKYRAVSLVFEGVQKTMSAVVQTMYDMEKQAARVQRVSAPGSTPLIRDTIAEEAARTGASLEQIGEGYYQLGTQVKKTEDLFTALRAEMNLVIGTEADAREAARGMLQIYNQFPNTFDKSVSQGEALARIANLLAVTWKASAAELSDVLSALKYLGPVATAAGSKLADIMALVTGGTLEGQRGRQFGTGMSKVLLNLFQNYKTDLPGGPGIAGKDGLVFHFKMVPYADGTGIDPVKTLIAMVENLNSEFAKSPELGRKMEVAIGGGVQGLRIVGAQTLKDLQNIQDQSKKNTEELKHTTQAAEELRKTMTTTAVEFQRVWGGAITFISNLIDTTGLRSVFRSWADDLQHAAEVARGMTSNAATIGNVLRGQGAVPGDPNARRAQLMTQQSLLRDMLSERAGLTGNVTINPYGRGFSMLQDYYGKIPQEKGYLQQFMDFSHEVPGIGGGVKVNIDKMQSELARITAELAANARAALAPANPMAGGNRVTPLPGFDAQGKPVVTQTNDALERKQEEARKALLEKTKSQLAAAEADLEIKQKLYPTVDGRVDDRVSGQAGMVDLLRASVARLNEDPLDRATELKKLKYGIGTSRSQLDEEVARQLEQKNKDDEKEQADAKKEREDAADARRELYKAGGVFGGGVSTSIFPFPKDAIEAFQDRPDVKKGIADAKYAAEEAKAKEEARKEAQDVEVARMVAAGDISIRTRERGLRPNLLGGGLETRQEGALTGNITDIQTTIKALADIKNPTEETTKELSRMNEKLLDAQAALVDFHDTLNQKKAADFIKTVTDPYERKLSDIEASLLPDREKLQARAAAAEQFYENLAGVAFFAPMVGWAGAPGIAKTDIEKADLDRKRAAAAAKNYDIQQARDKYQSVHGQVAGEAQSAVMAFLHGQGKPEDVFKALGASVVNAALEGPVKAFTDPLVSAVTNQIMALHDNTQALAFLNTTMNGGTSGGAGASASSLASGGLGAVVAAGVGVGIAQAAADGAIGGGVEGGAAGADAAHPGAAGSVKQSDLQKGIGAALAAYSIGSTSAQQGVNVGNVLGGAVTGASIGATFGGAGALIGAGVGVVADLIGGLFHQNQTPTQTPQNLNPAYYNAPSNFDVAAYNYSAYGKLPTVQDVGFTVNPQNVPVVNVYVDGAKVAAQVEIGKQVSSATVSLSSPFMDRHTPA